MAFNRKRCFIRGCETREPCEKMFLIVPREKERRSKWCSIARQPVFTYTMYCCEDHFCLQEDSENWQWYKIAGQKLILKPHVVPHLNLQTPRKRPRESQLTDSSKKRKQLFIDALAVIEEEKTPNPPTIETGARKTQRKQRMIVKQDFDYEAGPSSQEVLPISAQELHQQPLAESPPLATPLGDEDVFCTSDPLPHLQHSFVEPITSRALHKTTHSRRFSRRDSSTETSTSQSSSVASSKFTDISSDNSSDLTNVRLFSPKSEFLKLKADPKFHLGLPPKHWELISFLSTTIREPERNVMIVLKKIKTDDSHKRLAYDFGLSPSQVSKLFTCTLQKMSERLIHFIKWPSRSEIITMMPIQFRSRFLDVQSIIDCFEVQIEKPTDPRRQALTWSDYKKCNTIKYLISCTPLGLINFISRGFGGRMSDNAIVGTSGFLNVLPDSCTVLADRGFKQVEDLLTARNVKLVRPASVFKGQKLSKEEVRESRRIACTRVHVERVISRVREFKMLDPHSCVDNHLINLLDHIAVVACALINLQDPILHI